MTNHTAETSALIYARVAGFAYVLTTVLGIINNFFIAPELFVWGNDAETAGNIMANEWLFRMFVGLDLLMNANVVLLAFGLYVVLKTANRNLALLALSWRLGEAVIGAVSVLIALITLLFIKGADSLTAFEPEQLHALAGLFLRARTVTYDIQMVFMSMGAALFFYLFFKSKYIPRIFVAWGMFTYVTMFIFGFIKILVPNPHPDIWMIMLPGALFELTFGLWLLFKGVNIERAS